MNIQISQKNSPIEYSTALNRIGGDRTFLSELLRVYLNDFSIRYSKLKNAIRKKNFFLLHKQGHELKGASANLSMPLLEQLSYQMEQAGKEKNIKKAKTTLEELYREYVRLSNFILLREITSKNCLRR